MTVAPNRVKLTYEHYRHLPDDGRRHEILDGDHVVTPAPSIRHQRLVVALAFELSSHLREQRTGEILVAPVDVLLSESDVVQPDLVYLSADRREILSEEHCKGAPDIVVEILSSSTRRRDELTKRDLYRKAGVAEYWIVDPELEELKQHRFHDSDYEPSRVIALGRGRSLETELIPGFELSIEELFKAVGG